MQETSETQFLAQVEETLTEVLHQKDAFLPHSSEILNQAARHLCLNGNAKRARPLLTLFFGEMVDAKPDTLVKPAVASELIHAASLMHDDVIDDGHIRRGKPTVNIQFSNQTAVLAGNYLLSGAFSLLKEFPTMVMSDAVDVISDMTKAAIVEVEVRSCLDISFDVWRQIAIGKTGSLFAWCGQAAARVCGDEDAVKRFYQCGRHIGTAFQLADDVRDLQDAKSLKDRFSDVRNKEPSFPILLAAATSTDLYQEIAELWRGELITQEQAEKVGRKIIDSGAMQKSCDSIQAEIVAALDSLGHLRNTPGGVKLAHWLNWLLETVKN